MIGLVKFSQFRFPLKDIKQFFQVYLIQLIQDLVKQTLEISNRVSSPSFLQLRRVNLTYETVKIFKWTPKTKEIVETFFGYY